MSGMQGARTRFFEGCARVRRALSRLEADVRFRAVAFAALLALIGATMFLLNAHTPLLMDDYDYRISWSTGQPVSGLADVIASQAAHYRLWGGRSVVHAIAQLFLQGDKAVFNAANALAYLFLLLELYALAKPRGRGLSWTLLLAAHAALFCWVPFFGTVFLWLTGACNYLWGTALALLPLLLLRYARTGPACVPLAAVVGLIAGWTNENTACAVFALVAFALLGARLRGERVRVWQAVLLAAQGVGIALMLLAPGNFARASAYEAASLPIELLRRVAMAAAYGAVYLGALAVCALLLAGLLRALGVRGRAARAAWLWLGAVVGTAAMIASPVLSDRSFTGPFVLALAGTLTLLGDAEEGTRAFDAAKLAALPLMLALLLYGGYGALRDVRAHEATWLSQTARIEAAALAGEAEVTAQSVPSHSRFTTDIALSREPDDWPNGSLSRAFGVRVRGELTQ